MWPFTKHKKKTTLFKCTYQLCASLSDNEARISLDNMDEIIVEAETLRDAQVELARQIPMTPHVYVHKIEKVLEIES